MLSFLPKTPSEVQILLRDKFKKKRKSLKITQQNLADKSGVSRCDDDTLDGLWGVFADSLPDGCWGRLLMDREF